MKKMFFIILTAWALCSCGNDHAAAPGDKRDSVMEPQPVDSNAIKGDTSMYQRMPNKMNDTAAH